MSTIAVRITVSGRVQGVGFRPFVYQLAQKYNIVGTVQNNMDGVHIFAQGLEKDVNEFIQMLKRKAPKSSNIYHIKKTIVKTEPKLKNFTIISSDPHGSSQLVIPIDNAICEQCLKEMKDVHNVRYRYPFINCTQCGPRYTIIESLPYDRAHTAMHSFQMCAMCEQEYEDVTNRRHHAQPNACESCGPSVSLLSATGELVSCDDVFVEAIYLLKQGAIIAVKGIGGYHLCCDATNEAAVERLRKRKKRPKRPLAVMVSEIKEIRELCFLSEAEIELLKSPAAPIVILRKRPGCKIAESVSPQMKTIGVMLPYSPLHHLLLEDEKLASIVLTSANLAGQPLLYRNDEAVERMSGIADFILSHNRPILHPVDDSVVQISAGEVDFQRRSRGFAPDPIITSKNVSNILAFGGQQKATFTIGRNNQVFISPHIGDLENVETIDHYRKTLMHLLKWLHIQQEIAVIDAHPEYHVRQLLKEFSFNKIIEVQHHHAHMVACMEENKLSESVWGIILDGTGFGTDGNIWGFEVFYGNAYSYERMAHLRYTPLPGGEKAIKEPWRNGAAMLIHLLGDEGFQMAMKLFPQRKKELQIISIMLEKQLNVVQAGTCGRLFDAVSAICGLCHMSTYDGEAAITLAELALYNENLPPYSFTVKPGKVMTIDFTEMLREIVADVFAKRDFSIISSRFHETIVQALCETIIQLRAQSPSFSNKIVFSGGSFHNRYIRKRLKKQLIEKGLKVYTHKQVPCNDGGLSYGQLFVGAAKVKREGN